MSKSVKIQDSPEFKEFKENFEATMDVMEKDPEFAQMKLPEEWERDFKETMEATWEEERQKKKKRIGKRIAIAAGVTLVTLAGLNLGVQQVQGEGLVELFQRTFNLNGKQYTTYSVGEELLMQDEEIEEDISLDASTLDEAYDMLRNMIKMPMFYVTYVPEDFTIDLAEYNSTYDIFNIELKNEEERIYIFQQQQINDMSLGTVNDKIQYAEIMNENLGESIVIYKSMQDDYLSFCVDKNHIFLAVKCRVTLEECEKMAESIKFY